MRYLKHINEGMLDWRDKVSSNPKTMDTNIYKRYSIEEYTINDDGSIDVDSDVNLNDLGLTKIPLKFRNVSGDFYCRNNSITSLEGFPSSVGGDFNCSYNKLTSLKGCPERISGDFYCSYNELVSLEGCPISVGGDFYCKDNSITSLEGFPSSIGGVFNCHNNPVFQLWKLFEDKDKIELFNDYDIIRGDTIVMDRLLDFLKEIGNTLIDGYKIV